MTALPLLHTKFIAPPPATDHLPRPHLIQWLENQMERRLILISAPPGYGKTTLLSAFLAATARPVAWYQLDPGDSDPTVFLTYLIESIQHIHKAIGHNARALLTSAEAGTDPQRVLTVLINDLSELTLETLTLVLEDYHYVTSPIVHQLVNTLLESAPANFHLIISTRSDPPLALPRLRARGLLAELRASDLRFRDEEIATLLTRDTPGLSAENLNLLNEKTEGWAAALQIVRTSLAGRDAPAATAIITGLSGSHRFVFEYLAEEVFQRLPPERQQFILRTALLGQMNAGICNALTDLQNAQEILDDLEKQNLFVASLDTDRHWFRYHTLFREFLSSKLRREAPDLEHHLELTAARYYAAQSEWEAAFRHYTAAGQFAAAALAAEKFAADYVERGRVEVLHRYLTTVPSATLQAHPELLLQHGNAHRRLGDAGLAMSSYEDARAAFTAQNNPSGASRALTRQAEVHRAQGNYRQAETLAAQALDLAPESDHTARAEALMALAKSSGFLTGMDKGRALAEQAVDEARLAGNALSALARASFLQSLGQICWWHGDPQATVRYSLEALRLAPDEISPIVAQVCIALVSPHLYWREFETARQYAERGLAIAQTLHLNELLPAAYTALGNVLTRLGETARAETALRQSVELAGQLGIASYEQLMATGYLAYNLYGQGRVDEAWQLAEGALWAYTGSPDTYEAFVCRSVLADVALENGQHTRAEKLFLELLESGQRRQFKIPLAMVYFGLGYIHLVSGQRETGLAHARAALQLIEPTRAIQLFIDQDERSRVVCNALVASGINSPFLEHVLEHLPGKRKKQALVISNDSAVVIKSLGFFQAFAGGQEITQDRWVSSKARDLLAYFITFRRERIPADRAYEAIWAEKSGRGLTAFHTALSRLRAALRLSDNAPRLILIESGDYRLDVPRFRLDVDEFDTTLAKARAASNPDLAAELRTLAISLYQGEYLSNLHYDWLMPERRRITQAYLASLRALADYHYDHARYTTAHELLQRALRVDGLLEDLHCQIMRVYAALGDRSGLVRQYQELQDVLKAELDMEPLDSTERLYQRLLKNF